jgi:hypothetical protein
LLCQWLPIPIYLIGGLLPLPLHSEASLLHRVALEQLVAMLSYEGRSSAAAPQAAYRCDKHSQRCNSVNCDSPHSAAPRRAGTTESQVCRASVCSWVSAAYHRQAEPPNLAKPSSLTPCKPTGTVNHGSASSQYGSMIGQCLQYGIAPVPGNNLSCSSCVTAARPHGFGVFSSHRTSEVPGPVTAATAHGCEEHRP